MDRTEDVALGGTCAGGMGAAFSKGLSTRRPGFKVKTLVISTARRFGMGNRMRSVWEVVGFLHHSQVSIC